MRNGQRQTKQRLKRFWPAWILAPSTLERISAAMQAGCRLKLWNSGTEQQNFGTSSGGFDRWASPLPINQQKTEKPGGPSTLIVLKSTEISSQSSTVLRTGGCSVYPPRTPSDGNYPQHR